MFRPATMKKVELVIPESVVIPVTEALAASHVFHPLSGGLPLSEQIPPGGENWHEQAAKFAALERRVMAVMEALDASEGSPPTETPHLIQPDVAEIDVENLEQRVQEPVRELEAEQQRLDRLQSYLSQVRTIAGVDVELDAVRNLRYLFATMGTIPTVNVERLRSSLEVVPSVLVVLDQENHLATVALFGTKRDAEILRRAARSAYLNPLDLPDTYRGTPAEVIEALQAGIERTRRRIRENQATIRRLHEARIDHLRHLLWRVRASHKLVETIANYGRLHYAYIVKGWVTESELPTLQDTLRQTSEDVAIEALESDRHEPGETPVALKNPSILRPFQMLVTNYGYPSYSETDPTLVTAFTFSLLFGVMFGDVGHGVVLALAGILLAGVRWRRLRSFSALGPLAITCGAVSMVFGFLYGSIFGFEDLIQPLWMRPVESIQNTLLTAVLAGAILLSLGMALNMINAALSRHWGRLLFNHNGLAGLVLYWSLIGLVAPRFAANLSLPSVPLAALLVISGVALIFDEMLGNLVEGDQPLVEEGVVNSLIQGFFMLFETVISLLSNTLSFVRIGAFAVAHGALGLVVLILANRAGPSQGLGYWVVLALGNVFVIGFEGLIVAIQTLRLEYYEFFGKFFTGGGVRYDPLSLVPRE